MREPLISPLNEGWEVAPMGGPFVPACVPGTVAQAVVQATSRGVAEAGSVGAQVELANQRYDGQEYTFRCRFPSRPCAAGERLVLRFGGIATVADVTLNGAAIVASTSMYARHDVDVSSMIHEENELLIHCRPLQQALKARRPRPRWRTKVVAEQQLRWFRTTMLGRAPGFAPGPEPVGPWRPVELIRWQRVEVHGWQRRVHETTVDLSFHVRADDEAARPRRGRLVLVGATGTHSAGLAFEPDGDGLRAYATLAVPDAELWWPHTHGPPHLYAMRVELVLADGGTVELQDEAVGFRTVETASQPAGDSGLALRVNGVAVFCRGAIWTPPDAVTLNGDPTERLRLLRDAGFNMIRVAGTMYYEDARFHAACDALGLMVWQDMMFANMDYPFEDEAFLKTVTSEARTELTRLSAHASTIVLCGNSEIEQQVAMLGMKPSEGRANFFATQLPAIARECGVDSPYVPSAPCGGDLAFRTSRGVANYFGVGAYRRPLEDARRAQVRFASECLAFSHVPEPERIDEMAARTPGGISPIHPEWKRGVPRDAGAGWDFEDVRDHYLKLLYGVDPVDLRYADAERYFELSRLVTGEAMAEVFGEWRRAASPCNGGIILWASDLAPGAGWGILDSQGAPKAAYWFLRRALQPVTLWTTDEGLDGVDIHVANDSPVPVDARLRVALYRDGERKTAEGTLHIALPAHGTACYGAEYILGRFADAAYAYRFGPPGHDVVAASLYITDYALPCAQAFRFPAGRPLRRAPVQDLGLRGEAYVLQDGSVDLYLTARALAYGVRIVAAGFEPADNYFHLEPGVRRRVALTPAANGATFQGVSISAVNAEGRVVAVAMAAEEAAA